MNDRRVVVPFHPHLFSYSKPSGFSLQACLASLYNPASAHHFADSEGTSMRGICCSIALLAILLLVAQLVHSQGQKQPPAAAGSGQADAKAQPDRSTDEAAI